MKKIFLIDWQKNGASELEEIFKEHFEIIYEFLDGDIAYKKILQFMPDLIVMNYAIKPSHSRATAQAIQSNSKIKHIPIIFVDGSESDINKANSMKINFIYTTKSDLFSQLLSI